MATLEEQVRRLVERTQLPEFTPLPDEAPDGTGVTITDAFLRIKASVEDLREAVLLLASAENNH